MPEPRATSRLGSSVLAAVVFLAMASPRLDRQGPYYDELHQATASFAYLGQPAPMFNVSQVMGLPALNMNYSGAMKTGMYGLYMRMTGAPFSVVSWRLLGLLIAAAGIAAFTVQALPGLTILPTSAVLALVLTDVNLLLSVRHDWGPVALSFALRMVLLGALVRRGRDGPGPRECAIVGLMLGLIAFEKLSGVVIALPLALLVAWCGSGSFLPRALGFVAGGVVGSIPLIFLNVRSLLTSGDIISLGNVPAKAPLTLVDLLHRAAEYVQLGAGAVVQEFILGRARTWAAYSEGVCLVALVLVALWAARARSGDREAVHGPRLVAGLVVTWLATGALLPLLPSPTGVHHWVLGTPFQYVGLGVVVSWVTTRPQRGTVVLRLAMLLLVVLFAGRMWNVVSVERSLFRGEASGAFTPALTTLGEFAAREPGDALFVAGTWGVGTALVCLTNNAPERAVEAFWSWHAPESLHALLTAHPDKRVFYVVALETIADIPSVREQLEDDFAHSGELVEEPLPAGIPQMPGVAVRRFVRRPA